MVRARFSDDFSYLRTKRTKPLPTPVQYSMFFLVSTSDVPYPCVISNSHGCL